MIRLKAVCDSEKELEALARHLGLKKLKKRISKSGKVIAYCHIEPDKLPLLAKDKSTKAGKKNKCT